MSIRLYFCPLCGIIIVTEYHLKEENAMSQPDTFVIVDGNSLMHRAFHALPPLSNEDGVFTLSLIHI